MGRYIATTNRPSGGMCGSDYGHVYDARDRYKAMAEARRWAEGSEFHRPGDRIVVEASFDRGLPRYRHVGEFTLQEKPMKTLSVSQKHQLKIAKSTLKMNDVGASIMGGMTKEYARDFLRSIDWSNDRIEKLEQ